MHRPHAYLLVAATLLSAACSRSLELPQPIPNTGSISGRAVAEVPGTDQVEAVNNAYISIPGTNLHAVSDQQGAFAIGPLPAGTYKVLVEQRGDSDTARQRLIEGVIVVRGNSKYIGDIPLRRNAVLTGRVTIQGASRGNQGISVFVPGTDFVSATADTGAWRLSNLPEGPVSVGAFRPGFTASFTSPITAQGGLLTTAVDLVIEPITAAPEPGAIKGTVNVLGKSSQGVTVTAWRGGATSPSATSTTDADGVFVLEELPVDLYRLEARLDGYTTLTVNNLLITSGTPLTLPQTLLMVEPGDSNTPPPPPVPDAGTPDAGQDDAGTDAGSTDAGGISAECASDNDCASGRLCVSGRCQGCGSNADCRPGYVCQGLDCVRACQVNADCPNGGICDAATGACGPCVTSTDCKDSSQVCLPGGSCGHCRTANDCPSGRACLATGCGACSADLDCGAGHVCEQGACIVGNCHAQSDCAPTQACVNKTCDSCTSDGQCAAGRLCLSGACTVANCRQNADCPSGEACANNLCGACGVGAACSAGQVCDQGTCFAGTCTGDSDCGGGQICRQHQCSPCSTTSDCGGGRVCANHACVAGDCTSTASCATGAVCKNNHCQACGQTSDCGASGLVCDQGVCTAGDCLGRSDCTGASAGKVCKQDHCSFCSGAGDCAAGEVCATNGLCTQGNCATSTDCLGPNAGEICVGNQCAACTKDGDCGAGRLCLGTGASARCTAATCRSNNDCPGVQACIGNQCTSCGVNNDCRAGEVCASQKCVTGNCVTANDCASGQLCSNNSCKDCGSNAECGGGRVCSSGRCVTGDCVSAASDCATGESCVGNRCQNCANNSDCGQSGVVCAAGLCVPGNCLATSDCTGGQVCNLTTHKCSACTGNSDCKAGVEVCAAGACVPGNCLVATDCTTSGSYNGKACVSNLCGLCTSDSQCPAGDLCYSGTCAPGDCKTAGDCTAGGQRLCTSNTSGGKTCQACTVSTPAIQGGCPTGYLCDQGGFCEFGACITSSDCTGGKVCNGHTCQSCTAGTESLCAASTPICNTTTGACVAGNCHHDSDCVAPNYTGGNGVCVNFACAGNCRSNADCAASGASAYCNPSTHQCGPCSATSQCSSGQVCTASSGGSCVPGTCSFDVACNASAGQSCVNNACAQTAPGTAATLPGGGSPVSSTEATSCLNCFPNVLSGNLGLYYSWSPNSSTVYQQQVALDASDLKHVRWRLQEGTNGRTDFPGFVLTGAQGLPMSSSGTPNDVFFTSDYYNFYAHLGSDGTLLWKSTQPWYGPGAMGIAGTGTSAVPTMAFFPQTYALAYLVRADTGAYRTVNLGSCSQLGTPVWGKFYAYYFCAEGIQAVDPVANIVRWKVPFPGGNAGSGGGNVANLAIWRAPGATQETLYFAASVNSSTSHMWSLTVTDAMTATYAAPTGYVMGSAVTPSANYQGSYVATLLDANDLAGGQPPRVVFAGLNGATSVTDGAGNLLAQVNLPVGGNAKISLAGDGTILGVTGANMVGLQIVPNPVAPTSSQVITKWSLPLNPSGQWQTFSYPTAVATPGATFGYLLEWGQPSTVSTPLLQEMSPPTGGQSFLASAPAWSWYGGDTGGHRMAPSYECVADADCPSPQACVLNRCIGQCRTGADCGQNLGCIMGQCEACFTDASCDTTRGQRCNAGLCYDPPASGTSCSKSTDCLAGQSCLHAACVPSPGLSTNAQSTVSFTPQAVYMQDTHGFDYSVWNGGGNLTVKAWDPATFDPPAPWLATTSSFSSLAITNAAPSGALQPFPVGVSLRPDRDTFFFTGGITSQNLYTYDGLPVGNGTTSTSHTAFDGRNSSTYQLWGALTQGMSKAGDGVTNKPALFSYSNGVVFAMDAMAASTGTGPLTLLWSGNTGGSDQFNNQPVPLLVGSDGTVYHFRANGNVQAWSPDGDPQGTIVGGTKAGKLLWTFSPANLVPPQNTWTNNVGYRPAIMNFGGATDTIFFCTNVANTLAMVDVNAGGFSNYLQTGATCNTNNATILVDTDGTVILATSNNLQLIAGKDLPGIATRGTVMSSIGPGVATDGNNISLGDDGVLYYIGSGLQGYALTAVQIWPNKQMSQLYQLASQNNGSFDTLSFPALLPAPTGGHLLVDYYVSGNSGPRFISSYTLGSTLRLKPGAWATQGGDLMHRNSLKVQ